MSNVIEISDPAAVTVEDVDGAVVTVEQVGQVVEIESDCDLQLITVTDPQLVEVDNVGGQQVVVVSDTQTIVVVIEGVGAQGPPGATGVWENEEFDLVATDITNGYIDLAFVPTFGSQFVFRNGVYISPSCYSISGVRITWTGARLPLLGNHIDVKYTRT